MTVVSVWHKSAYPVRLALTFARIVLLLSGFFFKLSPPFVPLTFLIHPQTFSICYRDTLSTRQEGLTQSHTLFRFSWDGAVENFGLVLLILFYTKKGVEPPKPRTAPGWVWSRHHLGGRIHGLCAIARSLLRVL